MKRSREASESTSDNEDLPKKRRRTTSDRLSGLSDEVLLRIASNLPLESVLRAQLVSKRFKSVLRDSQIWRQLYYERFVKPRNEWIARSRKRRLRDSAPRSLGRWQDSIEDGQNGLCIDWLRRYKIRLNWLRGKAQIREISLDSRRSTVPPVLARLHSGTIFTADRDHGLRAWRYDGKEVLLAATDIRQDMPDSARRPMTIEVDSIKGRTSAYAVFLGYDDGGIDVYLYDWKRQGFDMHASHRLRRSGSALIASAVAYPFLATVDEASRLCVYRVKQDLINEAAQLDLLMSGKSHTINSPLALSLRLHKDRVIVGVAYCIATYTMGWTVGLQESHLTHQGTAIVSRVTSAAERGAAATVLGSGKPLRQSIGTKPTSITYNHPYLLVTHCDNTMSAHTVSSSADNVFIDKERKLWGHTSSIFGAQIGRKGRAVSVSARGDEVRVWDLEGLPIRIQSGRGFADSVQVTSEKPKATDHWSNSGRHLFGQDEAAHSLTSGYVGFDDVSVVVVREKYEVAGQALTVYSFA